jgi:hypothetical protein
MPITPFNWQNLPAKKTPLDKAELQAMETRLGQYGDEKVEKLFLLPTDILQEGVIGGSTGKLGSFTLESNGDLKFTPTEGYIWVLEEQEISYVYWNEETEKEETIKESVKELTRKKLKNKAITIKHATGKIGLPSTTGHWMATGICVEANTSGLKFFFEKGTESGTSAAKALEAIAETKAEKLRLWDIVIEKTAGGYTISLERDRRKWAKGAHNSIKRTSGNIKSPAGVLDGTNLSARIECSGLPVRLTLIAQTQAEAGKTPNVKFGFLMDGASVDSTKESGISAINPTETTTHPSGTTVTYEFTPSVGSHLFQPTGEATGGEVLSTANNPLIFIVEEISRQNANNGTA